MESIQVINSILLMPTKQHLYNGLARPADYSMYGNVLAHLRTSPCWHRNRLVRPAGLRSVPELFVGSFSITRPNLTRQLSNPIKPNLIQLTAKLSAVNVNHIWTHKHNFHNHKVKTSWKDSSGWKLTIRGRVGLGRDFAVFDGLGRIWQKYIFDDYTTHNCIPVELLCRVHSQHMWDNSLQ